MTDFGGLLQVSRVGDGEGVVGEEGARDRLFVADLPVAILRQARVRDVVLARAQGNPAPADQIFETQLLGLQHRLHPPGSCRRG